MYVCVTSQPSNVKDLLVTTAANSLLYVQPTLLNDEYLTVSASQHQQLSVNSSHTDRPVQSAASCHAQLNGILLDQSHDDMPSPLLNEDMNHVKLGAGTSSTAAACLRPPPRLSHSAVKLRDGRRADAQRYSWNSLMTTATNCSWPTAVKDPVPRLTGFSQTPPLNCSAYTIGGSVSATSHTVDCEDDMVDCEGSDVSQPLVTGSSLSEYVTEMSACEDDVSTTSHTDLKLSFSDDECFIDVSTNNK